MEFYFIRHGQSENNLLYDTTGASNGRRDDPELTVTGERQAALLAQYLRRADSVSTHQSPDRLNLAGFGITHLYTSLMVRAIATGTVVARALNIPLVAWQDLHETGGIFNEDPQTGARTGQPGKNRAELAARYPDLVLPVSLGAMGWWNRPFEEREQRPARAERFVRELLERHGGKQDRVAVISHGGFYNVLLRTIFKIERTECWFGLNNASITRLDFDGENVLLVYMNRVDYLPKELVT
ncbi:MAG TPA: histidine phosphatase family protein [Anaerolineae bacterium]|nr:histidine phosphatase family protein [Anaerolineae bacterium]